MNCVIHTRDQQKGFCQESSCQNYCYQVCINCISQLNKTITCQPSHIKTQENMERILAEFKQRNFQRLENIQIQCMIQKHLLMQEFKQFIKQWIYQIYRFNDLLHQLNQYYSQEWTIMTIEDYLKGLKLAKMSFNDYLQNKSDQVLLLDSKKDELLKFQINQPYQKQQQKVFNDYDKLFKNILQCLSETQNKILKSLQRIKSYQKKLLDDDEKIVLLETVIMEGYNVKSKEQVDRILRIDEYYSDLEEHQRLYIESFAQCYSSEKNKSSSIIDDALQKINKSLSLRQNHKALRIKGILLYYKGDYEQSIRAFDQSLEIDPQNIQCYNNKAISFEKLGKYEEAIEMYNIALSLDPFFAIGYNGKGNTLQSQHKYLESIAMYDLAIFMNPKLIEAYNNKGNSLDKIGKHQEAIEKYEKAIKLDDQYVDAYNGKGNALDNLKLHQQAIIQYEQVIHLDPHYIHAYNGLGSAYHNLGDFKQAIQHFDVAIQQDPKYYKAYLNKGISLLSLKEFTQAKKIFREYLSQNPIERFKIQQYIGIMLYYKDMCDPFLF